MMILFMDAGGLHYSLPKIFIVQVKSFAKHTKSRCIATALLHKHILTR